MSRPKNIYQAIEKYAHHPLVAAFAALLIYGSWAACVNLDHGFKAALKAGAGQGAYAFIATLLVGTLTIKFFRRLGATIFAAVITFFAAFSVMLAIPLIVHMWLGTPDILEAISLGLVWGAGYTIWLIWVDNKKKSDQTPANSQPVVGHYDN